MSVSPSSSASPSASTGLPTAPQIASFLTERVIGQRAAVEEMAIALAKHLAGVQAGNILLIGSSGSGKTTLMKAVEAYLADRPALAERSTQVRLHANVLAEEGRRGRPGQAVIDRLLDEARRRLGRDAGLEALLGRATAGIVFVDEVDKIRSRIGDRANVEGIRAQEALLTLMENEAVPLELPAWAGGGAVTVDSSRLLFVCAGAFEGLYDAVYDRVTIGTDRGALKALNVVEEGEVRHSQEFVLRDWLRDEDLFDYGMTPQFLSRFDAKVLLETLGEKELVEIFVEMPDAGLRQARRWFESQGVKLALSPAAVRRIAREALDHPRLGARALKEAFRRVLRPYEFDPAGSAEGGVILIDEDQVQKAFETT